MSCYFLCISSGIERVDYQISLASRGLLISVTSVALSLDWDVHCIELFKGRYHMSLRRENTFLLKLENWSVVPLLLPWSLRQPISTQMSRMLDTFSPLIFKSACQNDPFQILSSFLSTSSGSGAATQRVQPSTQSAGAVSQPESQRASYASQRHLPRVLPAAQRRKLFSHLSKLTLPSVSCQQWHVPQLSCKLWAIQPLPATRYTKQHSQYWWIFWDICACGRLKMLWSWFILWLVMNIKGNLNDLTWN